MGRRFAVFPLFVVMSLSACTKIGFLEESTEMPPQTQKKPAWSEIAWIDGAWRYCTGEECPKPTPKTVAMDAVSLPVMGGQVQRPEIHVQDHADSSETVIVFYQGMIKPTNDGLSELERFASIIDGGFHGKLKIIAYANSQKDSDAKMARKRGEYVIQWLKSRKINVPFELEVKVAQQEKSALPKVGIVIVPTTILFN